MLLGVEFSRSFRFITSGRRDGKRDKGKYDARENSERIEEERGKKRLLRRI